MKPYLAVLYDSFLESVQSRVLWVLLFGWTLILAALFPLSLSEGESYVIHMSDITNAKVVLDQLAAASAGKGSRSQRVVYSHINENFQKELQERQKNGRLIQVGKLVSALNEILDKESIYDKDAWSKVDRMKDFKPLLEKDSLSDTERQKLNRMLIDHAFLNSIHSGVGQSTWITYAGMKFTSPLPFTPRQIRPFIETGLLPLIMWIGLGLVAMIIAVVITSPMIPDMFQTGSLHLLLSKPISRSYLFLSKYLGGCIFVAFNITYLLVGLYFYAGIQLGIWNQGVLWCIPLFIFAFMIFYSVSALAGLIWKNPIVCVVVTALFWGACFTIGTIRNITEGFLKGRQLVQQVIVVNDSPIVATQQGRVQFWDEKTNMWRTAYGDVDGQRVIGPVWSQAEATLYFGRARFVPFGLDSQNNTRLEQAKLPELQSKDNAPGSKPVWDDSRLDFGTDLPSGTTQILPWRDSFMAASSSGLFLYDPQAAAQNAESKIDLFGFNLGNATKSKVYQPMFDSSFQLSNPWDIAINSKSNRCLVYSRGKLIRGGIKKKEFAKELEVELEIPPETLALVAMNDKLGVVCPHQHAPILVDVEKMEVIRKLDEIGATTVKRVLAAENGRIAVLTVDGDVWVLNASGDKLTRPNLVGQGEASTFQFDSKGQLWVIHHVKQLDVWSDTLSASTKSYRPGSTTPEWIYDYIINPFYLVNPKPTAINETIQYLLRTPESKRLILDRNDVDIPQIERDPWQPIWSNAIFVAVMLGIGCWYLYRQDL